MPTEKITLIADTIDGAAEKITHLLEGVDNPREVIYLNGWYGWGASAILKAVVKQLRSSSRLAGTGTRDLGKIIHVDVSKWQSKRTLQKAIAEELELPSQVMALFDQQDEHDDFDGVKQSDRAMIPYVKAAIMNELMARRFLVVLHNGSGGYIDLWEVGVPIMGLLSKRVLWTSRGRFWHPAKHGHGEDLEAVEMKLESTTWSDTAIFLIPSIIYVGIEAEEAAEFQLIRQALYAEAEEVAKYTGVSELAMSPKIVTECILYRALRDSDHNINWEFHASNYWVCDGIIQDGTNDGRSAWEISDALQRSMSLEFCVECAKMMRQTLSGERQRFIDRWVSLTNNQNLTEVQWTSQATSFFCTASGPSVDHNRTRVLFATRKNKTRVLEAGMFEHSDRTTNLRVIHLSHCTFSFSSPPFTNCKNLRFLQLDHCKNNDIQDPGEEKESRHCSQQDGEACFRNLWVLELSYTDWYWLLSKDALDLMVDLRELNVKGVGNQSMMHLHRCSGVASNKRRLIKLRVVSDDDSNKAAPDNDDDDGSSSSSGGGGGERNQQVSPQVVASSFFPDLSSWDILKTIILDGCGDVDQIDCNALPMSLESFTLTSSVTSSNKIKRVSLRGCCKLKHLLLRGLFGSLVELDMSGTAIRTLDLSGMHAWGLKRLFLLGCEKLCAILWPRVGNSKIWLEILRIDTTTTTFAGWDREEGKFNKQQEATASISIGSSSSLIMCGKDDRTMVDSDSYISVRDTRLFRSLVSKSFRHHKWLHVKISSTGPSGYQASVDLGIDYSGGCGSTAAANAHKPGTGSFYADVISTSNNSGGSSSRSQARLLLWGCPPIPKDFDRVARCYISIQDETQAELLLKSGGTATSTRQVITSNRATTTLPALVNEDAKTLHLHDSLSITCLPGPTPTAEANLGWQGLEWCRLERCPNLEGVVFTTPPLRQQRVDIFCSLETFWASQLPKARYIWEWSTVSYPFFPGHSSFGSLVFLHLSYCPRLVHVLPLHTSHPDGCRSLETLEIVCCGDLREVFPSESQQRQQEEQQPSREREFPMLKRIHLYELPNLQRICGRQMLAPSLETVKVRGCWGLKRLPAVGRRRGTPPPVVNCEKEWWDGLEWDGQEASHHPSHYKPTYSAHCKKKQLRASVLR